MYPWSVIKCMKGTSPKIPKIKSFPAVDYPTNVPEILCLEHKSPIWAYFIFSTAQDNSILPSSSWIYNNSHLHHQSVIKKQYAPPPLTLRHLIFIQHNFRFELISEIIALLKSFEFESPILMRSQVQRTWNEQEDEENFLWSTEQGCLAMAGPNMSKQRGTGEKPLKKGGRILLS